VNHEEINKYGDTNVMDVLKRLPGITVDSGPGGRGGAIRMRGLGTGYTQILVNGERMPPGFSLDSIAPDMIERIEIIRGRRRNSARRRSPAPSTWCSGARSSQQRAELRAGISVQNDEPTVFVSGNISDKAGALSWTLPSTSCASPSRTRG
jgi:outer membrane cobalamin receptor